MKSPSRILLAAIATLWIPIAGASTTEGARGTTARVATATLTGTDADSERALDGFITEGTALEVEMWVATPHDRPLVLRLSGPGGSTDAGERVMAALAASPGSTSLVAPGRDCVSACAIAWLGARTRVQPTGTTRLGFHSARCVATAGCDGATVSQANRRLARTLARDEPGLLRNLANRDFLRDPAVMTYAASAGPTWVAWNGE